MARMAVEQDNDQSSHDVAPEDRFEFPTLYRSRRDSEGSRKSNGEEDDEFPGDDDDIPETQETKTKDGAEPPSPPQTSPSSITRVSCTPTQLTGGDPSQLI